MTWDSQFDEQGAWSYYQNINDLMQGIQLDNENWSAAEVMVQDDKSVEVFHLRKEDKGANSKAIGAISNRTFNYWTQGDTGTFCRDTLNSIPSDTIYRNDINYLYSDLNNNQLKIKDLGPNNNFWIEWHNALTGGLIVTTLALSNIWGNAVLDFPGTLSGDETSPIIIFKLFPTDEPFLSPLPSNDFETSIPLGFSRDETIPNIEMTNWTNEIASINLGENLNVFVSPNPTQGIINVQIIGDLEMSSEWSINSESGKFILNGFENSSNFEIDLTFLSSGIYFLNIQLDGEKSTIKIIKL